MYLEGIIVLVVVIIAFIFFIGFLLHLLYLIITPSKKLSTEDFSKKNILYKFLKRK